MAKFVAKPVEDPDVVIVEQSSSDSLTNPEAPVIKIPLLAPHPFQDIERQNALEESGIEAHLKEMDKLTVQNSRSEARSGEFVNVVRGDPYAGFAKGPRDAR